MSRVDQKTILVIWPVLFAAACGPGPLTYEADVKPIVDAKCGGCHREGGIAPFSLSSFDEVYAQRFAMRNAVLERRMPPVLAAKGCTDYADDASLDDQQIATLSEWAQSEALQGEPTAPSAVVQHAGLTRVDLSLPMPGSYAPQSMPDDYRCFVLDWPKSTTQYVVGFRAVPGNPSIVHHVIAYLAPPESAGSFVAKDEAEPGPGYSCFGGNTNAGWLGSWAPGGTGGMYPEGTGLQIKPGSKIVLQVHYNLQSAGASAHDLTSIELALSDSVKKKGAFLPFTNFNWVLSGGMTIPAFDSDVMHNFVLDPTPWISAVTQGQLRSDRPITLYSAASHQHLLGSRNHLEIQHQDGGTECMLDVPRWDFHWQHAYWFAQPKVVRPGDQISIECHWNNSAEAQPMIDGTRQTPRDVDWGEGTRDEMCLGVIYATE
jgi:hypothetical protein